MKIRVGLTLALMAVLLFSATPAYADTPDPDSPPTLEETNIYRNLLVSGDLLVLIYANIPYATLPDLPVTQTFIWRFISTDNVTEFASTTGYAYNDDGYGYNVWSMYLTAAEVTTLGIVWGTSYTLRLAGNPAAFDTPPIYNYTINAGDYSAAATQAAAQAELESRILVLAADLDTKWGLASVYSLLTQTETATVLSIYGEAFFRGAIHGLQAMAPGIFSVVVTAIDIDPREWSDNYTANLTSQWGGTWVDTSQAAGKVLFGTDYDLLSLILLLGMAGLLLYGNITLTGDHWNGLVDVALIFVIGARLGMFDLAMLILVAAICWIYIGTKVWFGLIK